MIRRYWWEKYPERLQYELDALERAGIAFERDEEAFAHGILRLNLQMEVAGERLPLVVTFPDLYPYFRFEVDAPTLSLAHHQNPFGKNLCLIGRGTYHWQVTDTVASLLQQQLSAVLETGRSSDRESARGREQHQAEPFSDFYPYAPSMAVVNGAWKIPQEYDCGTFTIATDGPQGPPSVRFVQGALAEVRAATSEIIAEADTAMLAAFPGARLQGYWIRAREPIQQVVQDQFLEEILTRFSSARSAPANRVDSGWLQIWGVVFPEEIEWRRDGDGWVFLCLFNPQRSGLIHPQVLARQTKPDRDKRRRKKRKR